jgi:glucan phosphoethanolaminetransferase (alkaline phosphatase superfamily)
VGGQRQDTNTEGAFLLSRIGTLRDRWKRVVGRSDGNAAHEPQDLLARCTLVALWLFLFSPIFLKAIQGSEASRFDKSLLFSLLATILWAGALHFSVRRPLWLHALLLPLYVTTGIDLFLIATFGTRLSSGYVIIGITNLTSVDDFLSTYATPALVILILTASIYGLGLFTIRRLKLRPRRKISAACLSILLLAYIALIARSLSDQGTFEKAVLEVAGYENSAPIGSIFQTSLALYLFNQEAGLKDVRERHHFGAKRANTDDGEVYVWVVGESSRALNWSLLGYSRKTTPYLDATPGIIPLPNMLSTAPITDVAVPSMLSPWPITDWYGVLTHRSVVSAFDEAGFTTYWLSTQRVDGWSGAIPWISAEAKHVQYFDQAFDGITLKKLREVLTSAKKGENLFIVLHLNGSHFAYARRYPTDFAHFHHDHATYREQVVDEYDNTVLYTDWLLHEIIASLSNSHRAAALIYASDHGENLLDDKTGILGHGIGTIYDLHPASFIWFSEALRTKEPQAWERALANSDAKLSLSNLPHSALDLAGIQIPQLDPTESIFSSSFAAKDRWYSVRGTLYREAGKIASK